MLLIALALQIAAPLPNAPNSWFKAEDTPDFLFNRTGLWWVPIRLTVGSDGNLLACAVEGTSGIAALDTQTCTLAASRAKFQAAEINGTSVFGVYRTSVSWAIADAPYDTSKIAGGADADVTVKALPAGIKSPALVRIQFAVAPDGTKSDCGAEKVTLTQYFQNDPALVSIACDQIMSGYRAIPATDSGRTVQSVQDATLRFIRAR